MAAAQPPHEVGKELMRTLVENRKRTNSLGSHADTRSSDSASPEISATGGAVPALTSAWTGPRSGSAPPDTSRTSGHLPLQPQAQAHSKLHSEEVYNLERQADSQNGDLNDDGELRREVQSSHSSSDADQRVDQLLLDGLKVAKDRLLLLRSDLEMEKLLGDASRTRLRVTPPSFPPNLNSYQRLLIHRLADTWCITRELEPASTSILPTSAQASNAGSMISGTIVLVKTEQTKLPGIRIATLAPAIEGDTEPAVASPAISLVSKIAELKLNITPRVEEVSPTASPVRSAQEDVAGTLPSTLPDSATASQTTLSGTSSTSASPSIATGPVRIMSRASNAGRAGNKSSRSPSAGSGTQAMTFEQREAAYQQARMRIFNESQISQSVQMNEPARASSMPPPQEYQHSHQPYPPLQQPQQQQYLQPYQSQMQSPFLQQQTYTQQPQQHMVMVSPPEHVSLNPSLRPSAPVFVYQPVPNTLVPVGQQHSQQQQLAYYPVSVSSDPQGYTSPPIHVTMPSPALVHAQQPQAQIAYTAYPVAMSVPSFTPGPGSAPYSRPPSAHSHSSHSSISTTTSTSSLRTASTSSAQRSNLSVGTGYPTPFELRPMRQTSAAAGPSSRQVRPSARPSLGSASTTSNVSTHSRHSQSSSSGPSVTGGSGSSSRLPSSRNSQSDSGSPERQLSRTNSSIEETPLPGPHANLPSRPSWVDQGTSAHTETSSASSVSSASSRAHASDLTDDHPSVRREDAHTPLSSTSGKNSTRGVSEDKVLFDNSGDLATVAEDDMPEARSTPLPHHMPLPGEDFMNDTSSVSSRDSRFTSVSQVPFTRSTQKKPQNGVVPNVIENPPLRYDKLKGWTALHDPAKGKPTNGQSTRSYASSSGPPSSAGDQPWRPSSPTMSVTSTSSWPYSRQQQMQHGISSQPHQPVTAGSLETHLMWQQQQQHQHYVMMPMQSHQASPAMPLPPPGQGPYGYSHQALIQQPGPPSQFVQSSPGFQPVQLPYHQLPVQSNPGTSGHPQGQPVQVYYQQVPASYQHQPNQSYGQLVPPPMHNGRGGLTPTDMLANGEMLYSYDLPRPVPRSGATLFDPNASN